MSDQTTPQAQAAGDMPRREFLGRAAAIGGSALVLHGAYAAGADTAADGAAAKTGNGDAERTVVVGVMGLSRGRALADSFAKRPNVQVKYLCDVDQTRADSAAALIAKVEGQSPQAVTDFRKILDDPQVDALICAAPNHWHGPATILACTAGKHVYVEKPASHNAREGELMIEAARKHKRAVQMGSQRRSGPGIIAGVQAIQDGEIGRAYYARSWYANVRGPIGKGKPADVPENLDFELWQGPAPRVEYVDNLVHYNWHWRWHWGNGELGNNGVHSLDLCRWALGVDYPTRVVSSGGRYAFDDDQQTPDTHVVSFEFPGRKQIMWEGLSCNRHGINRTGFGVTVHGETGTIELTDNGYIVYDNRGKEVKKAGDGRGDIEHIDNFLQAIREDDPTVLNQEIESGHKSTLLCHLGNIAHRTGRTIICDPQDGHVQNDKEAAELWGREYAPGWEPRV
jgi:predicted dehydrogenase